MTFYRNNYDYVQLDYDPEDQQQYYPQQQQYSQHQFPNIYQPKQKIFSVTNTNRIIANVNETQYDVVLDVCENILKWKLVYQRDHKNWDLYWTDHAVPIQMLMKMQQHQKINHFPGMNNLSRKNLLAKNLLKMSEKFADEYDFFPKTWLLPYDFNKLKHYTQQLKKLGISKTFIVKPEANSQGRGIFLTKNINQIQYNEHCVVQKYITNPLLYQGLKFDLRVYVLVAGCDPLRLYIYNQGLVRLATEPYQKPNSQNMDNMFMHLTNYAINKDHPNFVFNQTQENLNYGHKRSLAEFFQTLKREGVNSVKIWADIKDIIVKTMISGQPYLSHQYRICQPHNLQNNMCFQILGFDLMVNAEDKVFLLEINYTPSFSCESPLDQLVKSNLIKDTLILMNINQKNRELSIQKAKQIQQKRVFTGKTVKLDKGERLKLIQKYQKERDFYEHNNLGSFQKIYPSFKDGLQTKYLQFIKFSQQCYNTNSLTYKKNTVNNINKKPGKNNIKKLQTKNEQTTISIQSGQEEQYEQYENHYQTKNTINPNYSRNKNSESFQGKNTINYETKIMYPSINQKQYRQQSLPSVYQKFNQTPVLYEKNSRSNLFNEGKHSNYQNHLYISGNNNSNVVIANSPAKFYENEYPEAQDYTMFSKHARKI